MRAARAGMIKTGAAVLVFYFSCAGGAYAKTSRMSACLSPRTALPAVRMVIADVVKETERRSSRRYTNHHFSVFLRKLAVQIGTADHILAEIKERYRAEFGPAIERLERNEQVFLTAKQQWVITHEKEVMLIAYAMGKVIGLDERECACLAIAARFHDIGKCAVDPAVINDDRLFEQLLKETGKAQEEEREHIRNQIVEHTVQSYHILKNAGIKNETILDTVFYHHANVDGSGYPDPITRRDIPLFARITRVADSFSAMLGDRPYPRKFQKSFQDAVNEIDRNIYYMYGPRMARAFFALLEEPVITNKHKELYHIPAWEAKIFRRLNDAALADTRGQMFERTACGISEEWNALPYAVAVSSIGTHRHAVVNLIISVLDDELRLRGVRKSTLVQEQMRRLTLLSYQTMFSDSDEARLLITHLSEAAGNPFTGKVIYSTLRPCKECLALLGMLKVKEIYFGEEHVIPSFIAESEETVALLRQNGIRVAQAHYRHEGVRNPNRLFFALCRHDQYPLLIETIDRWVADIVNHDDEHHFPQSVIEKRVAAFDRFLQHLIGKNSDTYDIPALLTAVQQARAIFDQTSNAAARFFTQGFFRSVMLEQAI